MLPQKKVQRNQMVTAGFCHYLQYDIKLNCPKIELVARDKHDPFPYRLS